MLTRYDDPRRMADLALAVAGDARVVADVLMSNVGDAKLGAVVKDADGGRDVNGVGIPVPEDLWRRRALRLAVEDDGIAQVDVDYVLRRNAEARRRCKRTGRSQKHGQLGAARLPAPLGKKVTKIRVSSLLRYETLCHKL